MKENEVENSIERGNLESSTIRNVSKVLKWVNEVSIYRPRSSGHLASFKRSSGGFFIKKSRKYAISHELQQFRTIVQSGKSVSTIFVFLERFAWSFKINFHFSLGVLQPKSILFQFARLCEFFACSCEIEEHGFSIPFCNFSHFFILIPLQPPPNPNPNRLHCFFYYAFGSSSTLFVFFNLIHLFCHQFIKNIPWNDSKTS